MVFPLHKTKRTVYPFMILTPLKCKIENKSEMPGFHVPYAKQEAGWGSSVVQVSGDGARGWEFDSPIVPPGRRANLYMLAQAAQSQGAPRTREWYTTSVYSLSGKPW